MGIRIKISKAKGDSYSFISFVLLLFYSFIVFQILTVCQRPTRQGEGETATKTILLFL